MRFDLLICCWMNSVVAMCRIVSLWPPSSVLFYINFLLNLNLSPLKRLRGRPVVGFLLYVSCCNIVDADSVGYQVLLIFFKGSFVHLPSRLFTSKAYSAASLF